MDHLERQVLSSALTGEMAILSQTFEDDLRTEIGDQAAEAYQRVAAIFFEAIRKDVPTDPEECREAMVTEMLLMGMMNNLHKLIIAIPAELKRTV